MKRGRVKGGKKGEGLRVGKGGRVEGRKKGKGCGLEKGEGEVLRVGKVVRERKEGRVEDGEKG